MAWDILVKGGTVIDPSRGLHGVADVAISGDKIDAVGPNLGGEAPQVIDATGRIVTAGFIDLHTHNYTSNPNLPSLDADTTSLANGATTVLDAGTATPSEFPHYWETDLADAQTRIYALIRMPMPYGPDLATVEEAAGVIKQYSDVLIGMKFHHSQHYVTLPLAREAADFGGGILMAEAYGAPIPQLLDYMNPGDILTHTFHASFRYPLWDHRGEVWPAIWDAVERGVYLDIGHGARGFSFRTMEYALEKGLRPSTISTDLHVRNIDGPTFDMPTTMSKMLALGVSLDDVIEMSTSIPAKALRQEGFIGTLKPGAQADVVVSDIAEGAFTYLDVLHEKRVGKQRIVPETVIFGGKRYTGSRYEPTDMTHESDAPPGFIEGT
jgi:dihydroorotase